MSLVINNSNMAAGKNYINKLTEKSVVKKEYFINNFIEPNQKTTRYSGRSVVGKPMSVVNRGETKDIYFYNELVGASFVSSYKSLLVPNSLKKKKIYIDYFIRDQDFWRETGNNRPWRNFKRKKKFFKKSDIFFFRAQPVCILRVTKKKLYSYSSIQSELLSFYNSISVLKKKIPQEKRKWKGQRFKVARKYRRWFKAFFKRGVVDKFIGGRIKTAYQVRLFNGRGKAKRLFGKAFRRALPSLSV